MPGRLLLSHEIGDVLPLEDRTALQAARPVGDSGGVRLDKAKVEARRRAMVKQLPPSGIALIVLGGSHDLAPHFGPDVLYVRVTPRSYPGE